jgi:Nuclease-related domain
MMKTHWSTLTPSRFPWERAALDVLREGPPDGAFHEVDLLVLTKQGFWLVEIKSRPWRVEGDAGAWTWTEKEGRRFSLENPVPLADRKVPMPWLEALGFLSDPDLRCDLQGAARNRVVPTDHRGTARRSSSRPARRGSGRPPDPVRS